MILNFTKGRSIRLFMKLYTFRLNCWVEYIQLYIALVVKKAGFIDPFFTINTK